MQISGLHFEYFAQGHSIAEEQDDSELSYDSLAISKDSFSMSQNPEFSDVLDCILDGFGGVGANVSIFNLFKLHVENRTWQRKWLKSCSNVDRGAYGLEVTNKWQVHLPPVWRTIASTLIFIVSSIEMFEFVLLDGLFRLYVWAVNGPLSITRHKCIDFANSSNLIIIIINYYSYNSSQLHTPRQT